MKPGYFTSEFGLLVIACAVMVLNSILGLGIPTSEILSFFGLSGAYTGQRFWSKKTK